ncbi:hypothetical protein FCULG_00012794 [Fusarium culmorum]|uniref:Uncharacterized protein n=1 Tax=Fusarium culmorum TaxID=5516 RepID=A0A2T4GIU6_FUSCU|nr:hypothetical protein FCULG_00012794 [Fusarium culmorum]
MDLRMDRWAKHASFTNQVRLGNQEATRSFEEQALSMMLPQISVAGQLNAADVVSGDVPMALSHDDDLLNHIFDFELQFLESAADDLLAHDYSAASDVTFDTAMVDINTSSDTSRVPVGKVYCDYGDGCTKFFDGDENMRRHKKRLLKKRFVGIKDASRGERQVKVEKEGNSMKDNAFL